MGDMAAKYVIESKASLKKQLLDSLKLHDYEKEYAPETLSNWDAVIKG